MVDWDGSAGAPFWSSDGKTLAFVGSHEVGPGHSQLFAIVDGAPVRLAPDFDRNVMVGGPAYPGAPPRFLADGTLVFCARDRGCTNAYALRDGTVTKIVGDEETVVSALSSNGEQLAAVLSSPEVPADVFLSNTDGSGQRRLTELSAGWLADVKLHRCEPRTFVAADGLEVHGWVMARNGRETAAPCSSTSTVVRTTHGARPSTPCTSTTRSSRRRAGASCVSTHAGRTGTARSS